MIIKITANIDYPATVTITVLKPNDDILVGVGTFTPAPEFGEPCHFMKTYSKGTRVANAARDMLHKMIHGCHLDSMRIAINTEELNKIEKDNDDDIHTTATEVLLDQLENDEAWNE